jgi:GNAT superfamily N-acetyltransferase
MSLRAAPDLTKCVMRPAGPDDRAAVLDLFNHVMAHMPRTEEEYTWQYESGPAGPAALRVIECEGCVVSLYVGTRKRLWVHGQAVPCVMVQDVMTHPDFRGRGFLNYMANRFLEEIRDAGLAGFTFPNKQSENSFRRTGWTELMPIPLRITATDASASAANSELEPVEEFTRETAGIWAASGLGIGVQRDRAFLAWRYARPNSTYHRFWIGGDVGYLVLKVHSDIDRRVVHVCDLVVRETARGLLSAVLEGVHAFAAAQEAPTVTCWMPDFHPYATAFAAAGFARDETNNRYAFVTGSPDLLARLADATAWHFSQADNDIY